MRKSPKKKKAEWDEGHLTRGEILKLNKKEGLWSVQAGGGEMRPSDDAGRRGSS